MKNNKDLIKAIKAIIADKTLIEAIKSIIKNNKNIDKEIKNLLDTTLPEYFYKGSILGNTLVISIGNLDQYNLCGNIMQEDRQYGWYLCINKNVDRMYLVHIPYIQKQLIINPKHAIENIGFYTELDYRDLVKIGNNEIFKFEI